MNHTNYPVFHTFYVHTWTLQLTMCHWHLWCSAALVTV